MRRMIVALLAFVAMVLSLSVTTVALAQEPPSPAVQICAATDVEAVDAVLAAVAETALVGELAPLVGLTVPSDPEGVQLDADVTLAEVRDALNCDPVATVTPTPTPTPTGTVAPTETPDPTLPNLPDADDDTTSPQVRVVPRGGVDTGAGSLSLEVSKK